MKDASEAVSYSKSGLSRLVKRMARHRLDPLQINRWAASLDDAHKRFTVICSLELYPPLSLMYLSQSSLLLVMIDRVEAGNQYIRATYEEAKNPLKSPPPLRPAISPQGGPPQLHKIIFHQNAYT